MKRSTRILLLILAAALIAGGIYVWCNYLQPFEYPALSGPYPVGRLAYDLVDESRAETFTDDPQDNRELMVYIWYPADVPAGAQRG